MAEKIFAVRRSQEDMGNLTDGAVLTFIVSADTQHQAKRLLIEHAKENDWKWIERARCEELAAAVDMVVYSEPQILGIKYHRQ